MTNSGGARFLVLSDMHFGTPESSINETRYNQALIGYIAARSPWEEIILTGDLLDVNLSTLTRAIEGGSWPGLTAPLFGFRDFVGALDVRMKESARSLKDLTKRWVYIPGNHDYKIWDMLATKVVCDDVLTRGDRMGTVLTPLAKYAWQGDASFFAGIFRRLGVEDSILVEYPNHELSFGAAGTMILTHGHYLDASQTRGNDLSANLSNVTKSEEIAKIKRRIIIETAQYQTLANAVSFTAGTRRLVNDLVGPDGLGNKIRKLTTRIGGWILKLLFPLEASLRGKALSAKQLLNIEYYLERFCGYAQPPRWFVFGHTHRQGHGMTPRLGLEVYNVGSCYLDRGLPITFLEFDLDTSGVPAIHLMCVDQDTRIRKSE